MKNKKLTNKQKKFSEMYIRSMNSTRACIDAGYSKHTAKEQGSRLLTKVNIVKYIAELNNDILETLKESKLRIIKRLFMIADNPKSSNKEKIAALTAILKAQGLIDPKKVELSGELKQPEKQVVIISGQRIEF